MNGDPCTFVAVWPIVEMLEPPDLIQEARRDLANVANRHRAALTGRTSFSIRPGAGIPGSGGAEFVVYAVTPAAKAGRRVDGPDVEEAATRRAKGARVEDIEFLVVEADAGWPELTQRLGMTRESIRRALDRSDRRDLLERLARREAA